MKAPYVFHVSQYPFRETIKSSVLYNTDRFLRTYPTDNLYRFVMVKGDTVVAQVNLYVQNDEAINVLYSGFGGIDHCLTTGLLATFINKIVRWCADHRLASLNFKLPSSVYTDNLGVTEAVLLENGFEITTDDVNQHINISTLPYAAIIRKSEQKRLRKCRDAGFQFRRMELKELVNAYQLIKDNRIRKGFPVTMTFEALEKMYHSLPENYMLFGVFDEKKLIATSVSIKVTDAVLYNFYHGDAADYRHFSPVVMIVDGVYHFCQQKNIKTLDLGTSSVKGMLNAGLFKFKLNCGGVSTSKKIFRKMLI